VGKEAIKRAGIDAESIEEIVMGNALPHGEGSLPARQVGLACGLPITSGAVNINQNCTSGMRALQIACHDIMVGMTEIGLVVGVENMSNSPYIMPKARRGYRMNQGTIEDAMIFDGLFDSLVPGHMGVTSENVGKLYGITREECDQLAYDGHVKACRAIDEGRFKKEIVPVEVKGRKGKVTIFDTDEHPRHDASKEKMATLKPAFIKDGIVTAANASGINDAAAAVIIMSKKKAAELGLKPLLKLVSFGNRGVAPEVMGLGPAEAIPVALKNAGWKFEDVQYWEVNEAFAPQFLGVRRKLHEDYQMELTEDICNHNGSGIALGHPVGCTALRIIVSMYYEMERLGLTKGGASLCVGTGPAMASLWTRDI
jgi:acetyl-CoA C-acetyltransferase